MNTYEGLLTVTNEKFCIVISRFNEFIGSKLLSGAIDELKRHGVDETNIDVVWCPGAFEIPLVAKKCASTGNYAAIITLGAVIIMFVLKYQKELHQFLLKQVFQLYLVYLQLIILNKLLKEQVQKQVIKVLMLQNLQLKWQI